MSFKYTLMIYVKKALKRKTFFSRISKIEFRSTKSVTLNATRRLVSDETRKNKIQTVKMKNEMFSFSSRN